MCEEVTVYSTVVTQATSCLVVTKIEVSSVYSTEVSVAIHGSSSGGTPEVATAGPQNLTNPTIRTLRSARRSHLLQVKEGYHSSSGFCQLAEIALALSDAPSPLVLVSGG